MQIDGLDEKPKPLIENLGTFKLKDKIGRNSVQIDFSKATRPLNEARYLYIIKVPNSNNKIEVKVQWKPTASLSLEEAKKKTDKFFEKRKNEPSKT